jgi:transcriptional regulator GlxA family with amidase domain
MSERGRMILEAEELAWVVLRVANRMQARGSTARLVVPRAPEVAYQLGVDLEEDRFLAAEEHLLEQGYVAPVDIGLTRGAYTITPAGLRWLERGPVAP